MNKGFKQIITWTVNLLFYGCMLLLLWIFYQIFVFASFKIPTDSMSPEVIAGDHVLVLKPVLGARLFNLFDVSMDRQPEIIRLPGIRAIEHNDMLVFNFPCPHDWNRIEMNLLSYYIKRCIGLPGDSLCIINGYYRVNGIKEDLGNVLSQQQVSQMEPALFDQNVFHTFPYDSILNWNIKNFGPLYIPKKGDTILLNRENVLLYRKLIEWEQQQELSISKDSTVFSGTKPLTSYCFRKNYYFMAGDCVPDSQDSRYWGLLPEEYIVGKAWLVWKSVDPYTGEFRWNRFIKRIK